MPRKSALRAYRVTRSEIEKAANPGHRHHTQKRAIASVCLAALDTLRTLLDDPDLDDTEAVRLIRDTLARVEED